MHFWLFSLKRYLNKGDVIINCKDEKEINYNRDNRHVFTT